MGCTIGSMKETIRLILAVSGEILSWAVIWAVNSKENVILPVVIHVFRSSNMLRIL